MLNPQVLLAFDFGMKNIGVAVGQMVTKSANALTVLKADRGVPNWEKVKSLVEKWQAEAFIVGLPYNMDGSKQPLTYAALQFSLELKKRFAVPIFLVDERLTTKESKRQLYGRIALPLERQQTVDSYAAKLILEQWLHERQDHPKSELSE